MPIHPSAATERIGASAVPLPTPGPARTSGGFRAALREAATSMGTGDRLLTRALERGPRARALDAHQLLALQARVYQHTQEMELAGRLVDRGTQAIKSTLQSQS